MREHRLLFHAAFGPRRQRFVTHLTQLFNHPPFRRIRFFTVALGILHPYFMLFPENSINPLVEVLKSDRLAYTDMGEDGGVLLDIAGHQVFTLNEVGMYLVNLIRHDDVDATEQLTQRLMAEFQVDEVIARADVDEFLSKLARFLRVPQR